NMDQGIFVGWLRRDGETITAGDPLFTLEGEKAAQDIEANESGILRIAPTAPAAGEVVAVGTVIGHLFGPSESPGVASGGWRVKGQDAGRHPAAQDGAAHPDSPPAPPSALHPRLSSRKRSSPLARRLARELGVDWTRLVG